MNERKRAIIEIRLIRFFPKFKCMVGSLAATSSRFQLQNKFQGLRVLPGHPSAKHNILQLFQYKGIIVQVKHKVRSEQPFQNFKTRKRST